VSDIDPDSNGFPDPDPGRPQFSIKKGKSRNFVSEEFSGVLWSLNVLVFRRQCDFFFIIF
jgi:hypothetical protein